MKMKHVGAVLALLLIVLVGCSETNSIESETSLEPWETAETLVDAKPLDASEFGLAKGSVAQITVAITNGPDSATYTTQGPAEKAGVFAYELTRYILINAIDRSQAVTVTVEINGKVYAELNSADHVGGAIEYNEVFVDVMESIIIERGVLENGYGNLLRDGRDPASFLGKQAPSCSDGCCCRPFPNAPWLTGLKFQEGPPENCGGCWTGYTCQGAGNDCPAE